MSTKYYVTSFLFISLLEYVASYLFMSVYLCKVWQTTVVCVLSYSSYPTYFNKTETIMNIIHLNSWFIFKAHFIIYLYPRANDLINFLSRTKISVYI